MQTIIRVNVVLALMFLVLAVGSLAVYLWLPPVASIRQVPAEVWNGIQSIQDIEHLRKISLALLNDAETLNRSTHEALLSAVDMVHSTLKLQMLFFIVAFATLIYNATRLRKLKDDLISNHTVGSDARNSGARGAP